LKKGKHCGYFRIEFVLWLLEFKQNSLG
jgi:hypothetical protein